MTKAQQETVEPQNASEPSAAETDETTSSLCRNPHPEPGTREFHQDRLQSLIRARKALEAIAKGEIEAQDETEKRLASRWETQLGELNALAKSIDQADAQVAQAKGQWNRLDAKLEQIAEMYDEHMRQRPLVATLEKKKQDAA